MKNIIKELWLIDIPLKKNIGSLLDITSITNEKCFFACYVIEYKSQVLSSVKKEMALALSLPLTITPIPQIEQETHLKLEEITHCQHLNYDCDNHQEEDYQFAIANDKQLLQNQEKMQLRSFSQENEIKHPLMESDLLQEDFPSFLDQCDIGANNEHQSAAKLIEALQMKESKYINGLSKKECHPQLEQISPIDSNHDENNTNTNGTINNNSQSKGNNNNNTIGNGKDIHDKFNSIDELYNYINDHSHSKKKNKRRGKPKSSSIADNTQSNHNHSQSNTNQGNNNSITHISNNNSNSITELDSIVEQFKVDLGIKASNASNVQKIKPKISLEWLKSIASN